MDMDMEDTDQRMACAGRLCLGVRQHLNDWSSLVPLVLAPAERVLLLRPSPPCSPPCLAAPPPSLAARGRWARAAPDSAARASRSSGSGACTCTAHEGTPSWARPCSPATTVPIRDRSASAFSIRQPSALNHGIQLQARQSLTLARGTPRHSGVQFRMEARHRRAEVSVCARRLPRQRVHGHVIDDEVHLKGAEPRGSRAQLGRGRSREREVRRQEAPVEVAWVRVRSERVEALVGHRRGANDLRQSIAIAQISRANGGAAKTRMWRTGAHCGAGGDAARICRAWRVMCGVLARRAERTVCSTPHGR